MAQIQVQLQNGQTGTMDDSQFDPSTMRQIGGTSPSIPSQSSQTIPGKSYTGSSNPDLTSNPQGMQKIFAALMLTNPKASGQLSSVYNLLKPSDAQIKEKALTDQMNQDIANGGNFSDIGPQYTKAGIAEPLVRAAYNAGPIGQKYGPAKESTADLVALASGKPTAAQAVNQKTSDLYNSSKGSIQNLLDTYLATPGYDKGGFIRGLTSINPYSQSHELENQRIALAATLKQLAGAGAGSGVRTNLTELQNWANLVPSAGSTSEQNKTKIMSLNKQMITNFGQGLDPQYLKAFGVTENGPSTNQPQNQSQNKPYTLQGAVQNTGKDALNNLQGIENVAGIGRKVLTGDLLGGMTDAYNSSKGAVPALLNEAKTAANNPVDYVYNKPVTSAMALLAALDGGSSLSGLLKGGESAVAPAEASTQIPASAPENPLIPTAPNGVQNLIRSATDLINGGGSKENIAQVATRENAVPQNQAVMEQGINSHLTDTGKIQATAQAVKTIGQGLSKTYTDSKEVVTGDALKSKLDTALKSQGYDQATIDQITSKLSQLGNLDVAPGSQNIISMKDLWNAAQKMETYGPKAFNIPGNGPMLQQISGDVSRLLRQELSTKVPESQPLATRYSALKDFQGNQSNPAGLQVRKSIPQTLANGVQAPVSALLNLLYKGAGMGR